MFRPLFTDCWGVLKEPIKPSPSSTGLFLFPVQRFLNATSTKPPDVYLTTCSCCFLFSFPGYFLYAKSGLGMRLGVSVQKWPNKRYVLLMKCLNMFSLSQQPWQPRVCTPCLLALFRKVCHNCCPVIPDGFVSLKSCQQNHVTLLSHSKRHNVNEINRLSLVPRLSPRPNKKK